LKRITLEFAPGRTVAIVGRSGSGKTTLIKLLAGLLEPTEGTILFDHVDLQTLNYRDVRRHIGMVLQENHLFGETISRNISFGDPEPNFDRVLWCAQAANAHEFIMRLPLGYETRVGESGLGLSGGQRQRIAIASVLITLFFVLLLASVLVLFPETVQCRFVLAPKDGEDPIQSPNLGVITQLRVTEGAEVQAGAELYVLRSDEISSAHTQLQTLTEDLRVKSASMKKLEAAYLSQLHIKTSEIAQIEREVTFRERHASTSRDLVARLDELVNNGGVSQVELIKVQLDLAASEKDLNLAQKSLDQAVFDRERMQTERARQRSGDEAEIHNLTVRVAANPQQLRVGMQGEARVIVGHRAPIEYAFEPIRQLRENSRR
jgi:ABC-type transport system involved in cytochrome c biogenesis ATPase subunit